jgi:hypothetical protein
MGCPVVANPDLAADLQGAAAHPRNDDASSECDDACGEVEAFLHTDEVDDGVNPPALVQISDRLPCGVRSGNRADAADKAAWAYARRPKRCRLATNRRLQRIVVRKLRLQWSLEQTSGWLKEEYPEALDMQLSHETIYRSLCSELSKNWAGRPLDSLETILNYARTTKTTTGLRVKAQLVRRRYKKGVKITDAQMRDLILSKHET